MCKILLIFHCILFLAFQIKANDTKDQIAIREKLENTPVKLDKIPLLVQLSFSYNDVSPDISLEYALRAKELMLQYNNDTLLAAVDLRLGNIQLATGNFIESKKNLEGALNIYQRIFIDKPDKMVSRLDERLAETYYQLGLAYYYLGEYDHSITSYHNALRKYIQLDDMQDEANVYQNVGLVLEELKDNAKALEYYLRSISMNRILGNKSNVAGLTQNVGLYYIRNKDYKKAKDNLDESLSMYRQINDKEGIANSYNSYGKLFQQQGDNKKALEYFTRSYQVFSEIKNNPGMIMALHDMGTSYTALSDYARAISYYNQSLVKAKEIGYADAILENYQAISTFYSGQGDFKNALENLTRYYKLKDSISSEDVQKRIAEMESVYRLDLKEQELARKNTRLKQQIIQKYILSGFLLMVVLSAFLLYRAYKRKSKAEKDMKEQQKRLEIILDEKTEELRTSLTELKYAEESERFKSAFMANMSHELRTPMNAIIAFTNFLRDNSLHEDKRSEYINYITVAGENLLHLVDDIIDSAKLESRQLAIIKIPCNITNLLIELCETFNQLKIKKSKDDLDFKISLKSLKNDVVILTDPFRLKQILNNLLENAMKYTDEGYVEFGYTLQKGMVKFFVSDTGIGIPSDKFDFIFQRFSQIDIPSKSTFGGTGLGLSITKNLVELLDGKIWVESEVCAGSTFYITLPCENIEVTPHQAITDHKQMPSEDLKFEWPQKSILVAEDEDLNFKVLESVLIRTKANILRARDGHEAVEICRANPIDLVLMDIQMPRMDGHAATRKIKEHFPAMPVIAQTSFAMTGEKEKCIEAGCDDYLSKPLNLKELLVKINKYIEVP